MTFEIRLSGPGGGVWTVRIHDAGCSVVSDFARRADVRYTADAKAWCGMALGLTPGRDLVRAGIMTKDGADIAMDYYFHQITQPREGQPEKESASSQGGSLPEHRLPGVAVVLEGPRVARVAARLRSASIPVLARVRDEALWLDVRTLREDELDDVARALGEALD